MSLRLALQKNLENEPNMLKKTVLATGYFLYAVLLTGVLLVVRFPEDEFLGLAERKVESLLPGISCTINDAAYRYPTGLVIPRIDLIWNGEGGERIELKNVLIRWLPGSPFNRFSVDCDFLGGQVFIDTVYQRQAGRLDLKHIQVRHVSIKELPFLERRLSRPMQGLVDFLGSSRVDPLSGGPVVEGSVAVREFRMAMKRPVLQLESIEFDDIRFQMQLQREKLLVDDGIASGPQFGGIFDGMINLKQTWPASRLDISGSFEPQEDFLKRDQRVALAMTMLYRELETSTLPFHLSGSLENPEIRFLR